MRMRSISYSSLARPRSAFRPFSAFPVFILYLFIFLPLARAVVGAVLAADDVEMPKGRTGMNGERFICIHFPHLVPTLTFSLIQFRFGRPTDPQATT